MLTQDDLIWEKKKKQVEKELENLGIDISDDEYFKDKKFKALEKEYVFEGILIPKSWWIEKNFVEQERLKKIYGIYAMGVEHDFSEKELKNSEWMGELADKYPMGKVKAENEFGRTVKNVEQYFFRKETNGSKESGLVERLKKNGIDIDKFDAPNSKKEKVKLLYFLFCFEFDNKVKISPFLSNPTLENVDNLCVGDKTRNGELMACLKNNILKEIDLDYARELKVKLDDIVTQWEGQIQYIRFLAFCDESLELLKDIREDLKWILSIMKEEPAAYSDSLLETFYLKLSCHEMIGREKDLLDVSNSYSDEIPKVTDYQMEKYKELEADGLTINYNIKSSLGNSIADR